mmetsp:Transcript_30052/g.34417  ORF Transcript_30052/g.34417 Transcript_30052/m.34417 type:complete len:81 (+) Transcript_30052:23-265(+)
MYGRRSTVQKVSKDLTEQSSLVNVAKIINLKLAIRKTKKTESKQKRKIKYTRDVLEDLKKFLRGSSRCITKPKRPVQKSS